MPPSASGRLHQGAVPQVDLFGNEVKGRLSLLTASEKKDVEKEQREKAKAEKEAAKKALAEEKQKEKAEKQAAKKSAAPASRAARTAAKSKPDGGERRSRGRARADRHRGTP